MKVDNETLEEQADNQTVERLFVEQEDIVMNINVTMVCSGKMAHIIIHI